MPASAAEAVASRVSFTATYPGKFGSTRHSITPIDSRRFRSYMNRRFPRIGTFVQNSVLLLGDGFDVGRLRTPRGAESHHLHYPRSRTGQVCRCVVAAERRYDPVLD